MLSVLHSPRCVYDPQGRFFGSRAHSMHEAAALITSSSVTALVRLQPIWGGSWDAAWHVTWPPNLCPACDPPPMSSVWRPVGSTESVNSSPRCSLQQVVPFFFKTMIPFWSLSSGVQWLEQRHSYDCCRSCVTRMDEANLTRGLRGRKNKFTQTCHLFFFLFFLRRLPMPWDTELTLIPPRS